jgi:RNase H-like domain found in reverse transcriptase
MTKDSHQCETSVQSTGSFGILASLHKALETLIQMVTSASILAYPDLKQPFKMEVDASAYAVGAILYSKGILKDAKGMLTTISKC